MSRAGQQRPRLPRYPALLSRIAQLDQRTVLPDQCLHSAEADVRPPRRKSGFDPRPDIVSVVHATSLLLWNRGVASRPNRSDLQNHFAVLRPSIMWRFRGFRIQRTCGISLEFALIPLLADGKIEGA